MAMQNTGGFAIPYSVRNSQDKGLGVFADSAIQKGTMVWSHVPGQYAVYDEKSLYVLLKDLTQSEAAYELTHMFGLNEFPGYLIRVLDDGVLINHSDDPNIVMNNKARNFSVRRINSSQEVVDALLDNRFSLSTQKNLAIGEELTLDYNSDVKDPEYYDALCEKYGVTWEWLE